MNRPRKMNIVRALRECPVAQVYEGAAPNGKDGSGRYWLSNQADPRITLSQAEVDELVADGTLQMDWPGFYSLRAEDPMTDEQRECLRSILRAQLPPRVRLTQEQHDWERYMLRAYRDDYKAIAAEVLAEYEARRRH